MPTSTDMPAPFSYDGRHLAAKQFVKLLSPLVTVNNVDALPGGKRDATKNNKREILDAMQDLISNLDTAEPLFASFHDGQIHHPLGGGSYAFQKDLVGPLLAALADDEKTSNRFPRCPIKVHAGAQPNNSPHLGTLIVFCYTFLLAKSLRDRLEIPESKKSSQVVVEITFVDTAPVLDTVIEVNGIQYQRSYRDVSGALALHMNDYHNVLKLMSQWSGVSVEKRFQSEFFSHPAVPTLLAWMIEHREYLARQLSPKFHVLALRAACPVAGCGLAEKHGRLNTYTATSIEFHCPHHGGHSIQLSNSAQVARLEANAPTRNLIRSMIHILDDSYSR